MKPRICTILDRLDDEIREHGLHDCADLREPVSLDPLLEAYRVIFRYLPQAVNGFRLHVIARLPDGGPGASPVYADTFVINAALRSLGNSARVRYAQAHEFGHALCAHEGVAVTCTAGPDPVRGSLDRLVHRREEREADQVAAYLLVRSAALRDLGHLEHWHVARLLDVPDKLIEVRADMLRTLGR